MLDDGGSYLLPTPVHKLDDVGGKARLEKDLDQQRPGVRDILSRFEHDGVTADECRKHFPGWDRHRKIEWADEAGNAYRPAVAHRPLVAQLAGNRFSKKSAALAGRVVRGVDAL